MLNYSNIVAKKKIEALVETEGKPFYASDIGLTGAEVNNLKANEVIRWTGNTRIENIIVSDDKIITVTAKEWVAKKWFINRERECDDYVVYTEIHTNGGLDRWYYGTYTRNRANEVALELGGEYPVFRCVCKATQVHDYSIKNLPDNFRY